MTIEKSGNPIHVPPLGSAQLLEEARKLGLVETLRKIEVPPRENIFKTAKEALYDKDASAIKSALMEMDPKKASTEQMEMLYNIFEKWNQGINPQKSINKQFFGTHSARYVKLLNKIYFNEDSHKVTSKLATLMSRIHAGEFESLHALGKNNPYLKKTEEGRSLYEEVRRFGLDSTIFVDSMNLRGGMRPWASIYSSRNKSGRIRADAHKCIEYSDKAYRKYNVDPDLILAVIRGESIFDSRAVSSAGATGLMQLMPATAKMLGVKDSFDEWQNVQGGVKYLKTLLSHFDKLENVLAGYNAGEGAVRRYSGIPPYRETRNYVKKVKEYYEAYKDMGFYNR